MSGLVVVQPETWKAERAAYLDRVRPWVEDRRRRAARGVRHAVYDFLFEYYSFRPAHLLRWTPGFGVWLEGATPEDVVWPEFREHDNGLMLPACSFPERRRGYISWALGYLEAVLVREPSFACFGLHEWAMVYRDPQVRHPYVPLRLSRAEVDAVVESQPLRCTHYDAYRFFTPAAAPRNRWALTRADTTDRDQPGCLHANMDLYKLAYKIAPYCPSTILADAFELAVTAREIDMRASPYDLSAYGLPPIPIETAEGRAEYAELQRSVFRAAQPVRNRLLAIYRGLAAACRSCSCHGTRSGDAATEPTLQP